MRKLLLAVAVMAAASTAQADFVIDDFHLAGTNNSFGGPGAVDVFSDGSDAGTKFAVGLGGRGRWSWV